MDNYIVSARKYRPSTFESVVGQKALTTTLKNAIATQKLAHAYLFCGPRGVGKTTCARIFAKTINCLHLTPEGEACNECESCVAFNEQRSYNIHELDAASNNSVDDIRQLVEQVRIPPQIGKYKVYIIDEVHMLSASAFNAFLKTLEEPPHHAIFILATTEKHKILPTILSRCQIYDFNRITVEDTVEHLSYVAQQEGVHFEPEALNVIALKADGGMRDALSIFDQVVSFTGGSITYKSTIENLNVLDYEYYFKLTDSFLQNNITDALLLFNDVLNNGFDGNHFINGLASHLRDLMVCKDVATVALLEVGSSIRKRYQDQAQVCPLPFLYKAMKLCNDCDLNYRISKNKRLLVELALIQIAQITSGESDDDAHGRSPKQVIKPVFSSSGTPAQPAQPAANASVVAPKSSVQQPVATQVSSPVVGETAPNQTASASVRESQSLSDVLTKASQRTESKVPFMKGSSIGLSIKKMQSDSDSDKDDTNSSHDVELSATVQNIPFDEENVNYYWRAYAAQLPLEHKAFAMRMQNIKVVKTGETSCEIVVDNELTSKNFTDFIPQILAYIRTQLNNNAITMSVRVSEGNENVKAFGKVERFQMMVQKNSALLDLKNEFGLEFY
ncbi:DNA polymerase III subunit gamma/tau [uncultured Bacteroides sp.]|uniref:DNA polymerase III subunit gamma/tau n=1 Tax=uncultured Bacteroides sp. TaxID=162156 RepID=UPI00280BBDCB|nr:DNA polymerase III subunit gamma/tau [uncultured Bacteroides sp.]